MIQKQLTVEIGTGRALLELAKAVCLIRDHAGEWDVDTRRVIVCGFSAGGHLACSLGTFWHEEWLSKALERMRTFGQTG